MLTVWKENSHNHKIPIQCGGLRNSGRLKFIVNIHALFYHRSDLFISKTNTNASLTRLQCIEITHVLLWSVCHVLEIHARIGFEVTGSCFRHFFLVRTLDLYVHSFLWLCGWLSEWKIYIKPIYKVRRKQLRPHVFWPFVHFAWPRLAWQTNITWATLCNP